MSTDGHEFDQQFAQSNAQYLHNELEKIRKDFVQWFKTLDERVEKLEKSSEERAHLINYASYLALADRIEKLEFHHNMQIDENRKMSRRVDEMESIMQARYCLQETKEKEMSEFLSDYQKRILAIEDFIGQNYKVDMEKISRRVDDLESKVNGMNSVSKIEYCHTYPQSQSDAAWSQTLMEKDKEIERLTDMLHRTIGLTFSEALEAMKEGKKVKRDSWENKDIYSFLRDGKLFQGLKGFWDERFVIYNDQDILATDWRVVNE